MVSNVNMLHTSNTAALKVNSNVVTEFPRSKKLIKYPRVALTSAQSAPVTENGYTVTVSNETTNKGIGAFDGEMGANTTTLWYSDSLSHYSTSDGSAVTSGTNIAPRLDTNTDYGEWISIGLPVAIKLTSFHLWQQYNDKNHFPQSATIYAKNESGDSWTEIYRYDNRTRTNEPDRPEIFNDVNSYDFYKHFAIVGRRRVGGTNTTAGVSLGEWQLFGVPEYDPEAHGVDVTIKSIPNVPNTDWLEVYYDAKGLPTGAVSNPISGLGGTTINGTATNVTVSDGAFVFNGSSSYITGGTTTISGNHHHSFSCWLKPTAANSGYRGIGYLFYSGSPNTTTGLFLNNNRPVFLTWGNNLISDHTLVQNEWVHVTTVYDGTGRTIYINSKQIDSDTYSSYSICLLYTSPSPRDRTRSRMPSSA